MNDDIQYAIDHLCKGHVSNRFSFYPGSFPEKFFAVDFCFIPSRNDFSFVQDLLGPCIENTMEIGVDGGNYSRRIVNALKPKKHYCVDPYCKYEHKHSHSGTTEEINQLYHNLINVVFKDEMLNDTVRVMKMFSAEALQSFDDRCFDFIYVDGNHWFEFVSEDLLASAKVLKNTGILAGHDFYGDVPAAVYKLCSSTDFVLKALALDKLKDGRLCPSYYLTRF